MYFAENIFCAAVLARLQHRCNFIRHAFRQLSVAHVQHTIGNQDGIGAVCDH